MGPNCCSKANQDDSGARISVTSLLLHFILCRHGAVTQMARHLKEFFLKNHTLSWGANGQVTSKKEHHHHTLAVSTPRMGQMEVRQTWSTQFSAVRLLVNQEPSVTYWNLRRTVPTIRPKAQTVWIVLALPDIVPTGTYCCLKHGSRESWNVQRVKEVWEWNLYQFDHYCIREKRPSMCISDATRTVPSLQENIFIFSSYICVFKCWGVFWMTSHDVFIYLLDFSVVRSWGTLACWKLVAWISLNTTVNNFAQISDKSEGSIVKMQCAWIGPYILEQKHCNLLFLFWRKNQAQRTGPKPEEINAIQNKVRISKNKPKSQHSVGQWGWPWK